MRAARCWQKAGSLSLTPGDSGPGWPARATSAAGRETNASAEQRSRRQDLELPRKNPKITKEGKIMSGLFLLLRRARAAQAQGLAGPDAAVDSGAQDRLDGVQPFYFRPKRSRGLGQLPGVFQALANDHLAGARVWITPAANRIHGRGQIGRAHV